MVLASGADTGELAASVALLGLLTGCTSHTVNCVNASCTVNLTGAQTLEVDPGVGVERDLRVGPIEPGVVTVGVAGDEARLTPGTVVHLSDLQVELTSVSGEDVSLRVDRV